MVNVNYMMKDQSNAVDDKTFFHAFNYIHPVVQLIKVQSKERECGNPVSNAISWNTAVELGADWNDPEVRM